MMDRRKLSIGLSSLLLAGATASAEGRLRYRSFRQGTRSMQPTIQPGDRVRVLLGQVTFDDADQSGLVHLDRGDLVAFMTPIWSNAVVIFRLIGQPGETISIIDQEGALIDGVAIQREDAGAAPTEPSYYGDNPAPGPWREFQGARFIRETLPNGISFLTLHTRPPGSFVARPARSPVVVPSESVFLLGDARDNANDSRFELGMIPLSQVIGKVVGELA